MNELQEIWDFLLYVFVCFWMFELGKLLQQSPFLEVPGYPFLGFIAYSTSWFGKPQLLPSIVSLQPGFFGTARLRGELWNMIDGHHILPMLSVCRARV